MDAPWRHLAVWTGLEPATPCVTGRYSNQLNYHTIYQRAASVFPKALAKVGSLFELAKHSEEKNISKVVNS